MLKSLNLISFTPNQKKFITLTHGAHVTHRAYGAQGTREKRYTFKGLEHLVKAPQNRLSLCREDPQVLFKKEKTETKQKEK